MAIKRILRFVDAFLFVHSAPSCTTAVYINAAYFAPLKAALGSLFENLLKFGATEKSDGGKRFKMGIILSLYEDI